MYGTVARMRIKPGMQEAFLAWVESSTRARRTIPGHLKSFVYQTDADPNTLMLVVVFESREAYHANAASAEQHAELQAMLAFLEAEPEWHDGEAIFYLGGARR